MGKLVAVQSADALARLIEKSSILPTPQLARARVICQGATDSTSAARAIVKEGLLTTWQARQMLGGFSMLRVGKYRLMDELGSGPLGRVYLAEHIQMARRVALKLFPKKTKDAPESTEKLLATARIISSIDHRNIVHIYDVDYDADFDRYFLVMELAAGTSLKTKLAETHAMRLTAAIELARQIASGLAYAHSRGIYHLELKPANVMLDLHGNVKILNLGVARLVEVAGRENPKLAEDDPAVFFQAPELRTPTTVADARADLFALGRLLYAALAGAVPLRNQTVPDISSQRSDVPGIIVELIRSLAAESPLDRTGSAADVELILDEWLGKQIVPADEASPSASSASDKTDGLDNPLAPVDPFSSTEMEAVVRVDSSASQPVVKSRSDLPLIVPAISAARDPAATGPSDEIAIKIHSGKRRKKTPPSANSGVSEPKCGTSRPSRKSYAIIAGGLLLAVLLLAIIVPWILKRAPKSSAISHPSKIAQTGPRSDATANTAGGDTAVPGANESGNTVPQPTDLKPKNGSDEPAAPPPPGQDSTPSSENRPADAPATPPADVPVESAGKPPANGPGETAPSQPATPPATPPANPPTTPPANPPAAAPADPFADFPVAVTLPALTVANKPNPDAMLPMVIGKLSLDRRAFCIIHLHGGATATTKTKTDFTLKELGEREWQVVFKEGSVAAGTEVARIQIRDSQVQFQWSAGATREPMSPYLANCVLTIAAGPKSRDLALRQAVQAEPLSLADFAKGMKGQWEIPHVPRSDTLRLELKFAGSPPPHRFEIEGEFGLDRPATMMAFVDKDNEPIVAIRFEFALRKNLALTGTPYLKLAVDADKVKITPKLLAERRKLMPRFSQELELATLNTKQLSEAAPADETLRNNYLRAEEHKKVGLKAIGQFQQVESLLTLCESLQINLTVTHIAEDKRVVLLSTAK